jgi:hypothetical protein
MLARPTKVLLSLAISGVLLVGCAGETTAPVLSDSTFQYAQSPFAPTAAKRALVGVSDGTYEFDVDPSKEQKLYLGSNALFIPPNSVCNLDTSSYGVEHWNEDCKPQKTPFRITAVVRNAASEHPSIDFYPALRFAPTKTVNLYFYVPSGNAAERANFIMNYCNDEGACYDESLVDPTLATQFNAEYSVVYRRIKHFSGYIIASATDESTPAQW